MRVGRCSENPKIFPAAPNRSSRAQKCRVSIQSARIRQITLDRLGRTAKGLTALFDELTELNVRLVSLRDGLDLSTAAGRLMANVLPSVAAYETDVRAERILAGQAAARAKGKTWGGSEKGRRIKVNDEQIRLIHRMKAEGDKVAAIARATGLSRPTIYDRVED
ncbi:recombinase family protein [Rosistilla oblonga]|uniref:recombinase family protein n=1 Tax=Rosistilla oblonga TaxID=2527990 RepID=UPI003A977DF5